MKSNVGGLVQTVALLTSLSILGGCGTSQKIENNLSDYKAPVEERVQNTRLDSTKELPAYNVSTKKKLDSEIVQEIYNSKLNQNSNNKTQNFNQEESIIESRKYVVKEGDSLWKISKNFEGVNYEDIAKANNIPEKEWHLIHPGDELEIPSIQNEIRIEYNTRTVQVKKPLKNTISNIETEVHYTNEELNLKIDILKKPKPELGEMQVDVLSLEGARPDLIGLDPEYLGKLSGKELQDLVGPGYNGYGKLGDHREIFHHYSRFNGTNRNYSMAIGGIESDFNPIKTSHSGACGLMQLQNEFGAGIYGTKHSNGVEFEKGNCYNHLYNVKLGTSYIRSLGESKELRKDTFFITLAYNVGEPKLYGGFALAKKRGIDPFREKNKFINMKDKNGDFFFQKQSREYYGRFVERYGMVLEYERKLALREQNKLKLVKKEEKKKKKLALRKKKNLERQKSQDLSMLNMLKKAEMEWRESKGTEKEVFASKNLKTLIAKHQNNMKQRKINNLV